MSGLRGAFAPDQPDPISVCPHCWAVNLRTFRLCARCGADMQLSLQESGGLRATAPVQSPVPLPGARLSRAQRMLVLCFLALLVLAQILGVLYSGARRGAAPSSAVVPGGIIPAAATEP